MRVVFTFAMQQLAILHNLEPLDHAWETTLRT